MTEHNHEHGADCQHDHNHETEYITLIDESGNETLYEIFMTIDGQERFGKNYVLVYPAGIDEDTEVELQAYAYEENETGAEGKLQEIESDEEWDMIEEVFNTLVDEEE